MELIVETALEVWDKAAAPNSLTRRRHVDLRGRQMQTGELLAGHSIDSWTRRFLAQQWRRRGCVSFPRACGRLATGSDGAQDGWRKGDV